MLSIINNAFEESLKQVSLFTLCCSQRSNTPISRPFRRISSGVLAMSISNEHSSDLFCWIVPFCLWCHQTCFDVCWLVVFCHRSSWGCHEVVMRFVFVDFSLVLWADFIWSFLGHYRLLRHVFDFFWNYFSETIQNFLKLIQIFWNCFFWNCPKLSERKCAKIIFWWQFSDLVDRQVVFPSLPGLPGSSLKKSPWERLTKQVRNHSMGELLLHFVHYRWQVNPLLLIRVTG
jgi:hypothetical protein